jgi:ArsR family transcriptional regulator, arsenate/arsenite/antimonite-responsive transcriptional repressor
MTEAATARARQGLSVERAFRALGDATRVRILHLLRGGALCVGDLVAALDVPQPTASRHLAYLRRSGLVLDERRGQWSFYKLAAPATGFHKKLMVCLDAALTPQSRKDEASLARLQRRGGCCPQHVATKGRGDGR